MTTTINNQTIDNKKVNNQKIKEQTKMSVSQVAKEQERAIAAFEASNITVTFEILSRMALYLLMEVAIVIIAFAAFQVDFPQTTEYIYELCCMSIIPIVYVVAIAQRLDKELSFSFPNILAAIIILAPAICAAILLFANGLDTFHLAGLHLNHWVHELINFIQGQLRPTPLHEVITNKITNFFHF